MRSRRDSSGAEDQGGAGDGWSKQELMDAGGISAKTFDLIRKAARVRGPSHGGLSWVFSAEEVGELVKRAESGKFTERGGLAAAAWRGLLVAGGVAVPEVKKLKGSGGGEAGGEAGRARRGRRE